MSLPDAGSVGRAAERLRGVAVRTPLLSFPALDEQAGGRIFIKPEILQRTGSFKFRGAYNRLVQLRAAERRAGVLAWSSGNHAQGVAAAAALLGIRAQILMPADAPRIKMERTRAFGAEVMTYDRLTEDREAKGREIAQASGAVIVPPFDDPEIVAGQGTAGLEIAEDVTRLGLALDAVLAPAGGGGLVAGTALAFSAYPKPPAIYCVEPEGYDDHRRSLEAGRRLPNAAGPASICDALMAPMPGELTFALNSRLLAGGLAVNDAEVRDAMRFAFREMKLVVEPGGAVALAAVLSGRIETRGRAIALILSGGNVDPEFFAEVLADA
jgi:threonine dehydratase